MGSIVSKLFFIFIFFLYLQGPLVCKVIPQTCQAKTCSTVAKGVISLRGSCLRYVTPFDFATPKTLISRVNTRLTNRTMAAVVEYILSRVELYSTH